MFIFASFDWPDYQFFRSKIWLKAIYLDHGSFLCLAGLSVWVVLSELLSGAAEWVWEAACSASFKFKFNKK